MDDIQTWLYIIIGIVYFVIRSFRKKAPENPAKPVSTTQSSQRPDIERRKPLTFEELLQEFTEGKKEEPVREELVEEEEEESFEHESRSQRFEREGRDRQFSDEESKRVYEESVKMAEGYELDFERDDDFKITKMKSKLAVEEETGSFQASDIQEMFQNPDDAKKAVILSEILGRKY